MSEQRFTITDKEWICYAGGYAYTVSNGKCEFALWEDEDDAQKVCDYLNEQQATIEQLRTQLIICQQSKNDDGRFKVWQVPPIPKGMRIITSTSTGEKDE